jgi:vacuolar-type H+-ATPase subunit I/STV1
MKRIIFSMATLAILAALPSCKSSSGSFEKDVRKRAEYMCKVQQLSAKAATDEAATKDLEKVRKELEEYDATMEKKYKDKDATKEQTDKAEQIMKEVMEKCK